MNTAERLKKERGNALLAGDYHYLIHADGGKNREKGVYGSYKIKALDGRQRTKRLTFKADHTHNEAEYESLIAALNDLAGTIRRAGADPKRFRVKIRMDSRLVLQSVFGDWNLEAPHLVKWRDAAQEAAEQFGGIEWEAISGKVMKMILGH